MPYAPSTFSTRYHCNENQAPGLIAGYDCVRMHDKMQGKFPPRFLLQCNRQDETGSRRPSTLGGCEGGCGLQQGLEQ